MNGLVCYQRIRAGSLVTIVLVITRPVDGHDDRRFRLRRTGGRTEDGRNQIVWNFAINFHIKLSLSLKRLGDSLSNY